MQKLPGRPPERRVRPRWGLALLVLVAGVMAGLTFGMLTEQTEGPGTDAYLDLTAVLTAIEAGDTADLAERRQIDEDGNVRLVVAGDDLDLPAAVPVGGGIATVAVPAAEAEEVAAKVRAAGGTFGVNSAVAVGGQMEVAGAAEMHAAGGLNPWLDTIGFPSVDGQGGGTIAFIGTGIDEVPALDGRIVYPDGWPVGDQDTDRRTGTRLAAVALGAPDGSGQIRGACPDCTGIVLAVADADGIAEQGTVVAAIHTAVELGADVLVIDLVADEAMTVVRDAIDALDGDGHVVVAPVGSSPENLGRPNPAGFDSTVAVGAIDGDGQRAVLSRASDEWIDLKAPAVAHVDIGGGAETVTGTNVAAVIVAAAVATLVDERIDAGAARQAVEVQARPPGGEGVGAGERLSRNGQPRLSAAAAWLNRVEVTVTVRDGDGSPLVGATVRAVDGDGNPLDDLDGVLTVEADSSQDGTTTLWLPPGSHTVVVEDGEHDSATLSVEAVLDEPVEETVTLAWLDGTATVAVKDTAGRPVEGAQVTFTPAAGGPVTATTGPDGTAAADLPRGEATIRVTADGFRPFTATVFVPPGGETDTQAQLQRPPAPPPSPPPPGPGPPGPPAPPSPPEPEPEPVPTPRPPSCDFPGLDDTERRRLAGASRVETSQAIAREVGGSSGSVAVAGWDGMADALARSPRSAVLGEPILITRTGSWGDEGTDLVRGRDVTIVGGTAVVADEVAEALAGIASGLSRIFGPDRFETAAAISRSSHPDGANEVFIALGRSAPGDALADALTGSPLAAKQGVPLLLVEGDRLPEPTREELGRLGPDRVVIFGGEAAVSRAVADGIAQATGADVRRIAGTNRFETAVAVAEQLAAEQPVREVILASGRNDPDALAAGPLAHAADAVILLVEQDAMPEATGDWLEANGTCLERITVVGGTAVVADEVLTWRQR